MQRKDKLKSLRAMNSEELRAELLIKRKDLFRHRASLGVGEFGRTHLFPVLRKDIARIKTILNQRLNSGASE